MTLTEKLDILMSEKGLNQRQLSLQTNIPYSTISNWYKDPEKAANAKLGALRSIANYFGVSLDYIADDSITDRNYGKQKKEPTCKSELQKELNNTFISLSPEKQQEALNYVRYIRDHSNNA